MGVFVLIVPTTIEPLLLDKIFLALIVIKTLETFNNHIF